MLNWLTGPIKNPQHGDCFYNPDESIICVFLDDAWYNAGPIPDDLSQLDKIVPTYESLMRDRKLEKLITNEYK